MERSEAVDCLSSLSRWILPHNKRLRRSFKMRFRDEGAQSLKVLVRKIKYILSGMSLREIVRAYKKTCFPGLRLKTVVFRELSRRRVGPGGLMDVIYNECSKAHGKYSFNFFDKMYLTYT